MTDSQFQDEIAIRAYIDQVDGYPIGHPARVSFEPIVPLMWSEDGSINREATLDLPCFAGKFTAEARQLLLDKEITNA